MSVTHVPLLNEYKQEFVIKRIPQTLLGGPNLKLGYSAPFYIHLAQILLWLLPWIISGIFTLLIELANLDVLVGAILTGCLVGIFVVIVQGIHYYKSVRISHESRGGSPQLSSSQQFRQLLADDDEIFFTSFCSFTTFKFVIPPVRFPPIVLLHAIFSGLLCGVGVWYTLPSTVSALYGNSVSAATLIYIFSWITVCIAQYPLNAGGIPPEVATFRSVNFYDIASLSRAFHIFMFFSFHIIQVFVPSFQAVNQVLHIVLLFLPLLWLSGTLPPIDALLLWACEQILVFALGGSPNATDIRLLVSLILSGAVLVGACFLSSVTALVLYSATLGFLLSTDIISLLCGISHKLYSLCRSKSSTNQSNKSSHFKGIISVHDSTWYIAAFALLALVVALSVTNRDQISGNTNNKTSFQITLVILLVLCKVLQDVQRVYVVFRIIRNCFYPESYSTLNNFKSRKKVLNVFGYIHMVLVSIINPLIMACYLSVYLFEATFVFLPSFVSGLSAVHAFRMVWQRSSGALFTFAIMSILELIVSSPTVTLDWFDSADLGIRLLVLDICIDRAFVFVDNLWFSISLLITSYTDKKQRRESSLKIVILNAVFFPVGLAIIAVASLLFAPLLPLFTLPLFYIAFPRPSRFWPQTPGAAPASLCTDSGYYDQMAPGLSKAMARGTYLGVFSTLGGGGCDMPLYVARSQDKTFWIQTLESGYGYVTYSVKGLELQETSCHALEATRLDEACETAFEKPNGMPSSMRTNPYPFLYGVSPIDTVYINGYSDAKNSLSGIIDYPPAIKQIHIDFVKSLIWLLVHHLSKKAQHNQDEIITLHDISAKQSVANGKSALVDPSIGFSKSKDRHVAFQSPALSVETLDDVESARTRSAKQNGKVAANKHSHSPSMDSLGSILTTDDETTGMKLNNHQPINKASTTPKPAASKPPGFVDSSDEDDDLWELESEYSDSGFGLTSTSHFAKKKETNFSKGSAKSKPDITGWGEIPMSSLDINQYRSLFDRSWYLHVASLADETGSGLEDELMNACREMALACYLIVFVQGVPGRKPSLLGSSHMCKAFNDDIPWSPDLDWLLKHEDLYKLVLQAHRYSIKLMYDRVVMGTVDCASDEEHDETVTSLRELDSDWFVGPETSPGWKKAVSGGAPSLFSISFDRDKGEYSARVLVRRPIEVHVSGLSSAAVRSIWANLSFELLYATNDDEERYSIQAHPNLLRNLTTQAADPPLGYPIFSSQPLYESTLPLPSL